MQERSMRRLRVGGLVLLGVFVLVFAYLLRSVFNAVLFGFLVAYILTPLVDWLERLNLHRIVAILVIYGVCLLLLTAAILYGVPLVASEAGSIVDAFIGEEYTDSNMNGRWDGPRPATDEQKGEKRLESGAEQPAPELVPGREAPGKVERPGAKGPAKEPMDPWILIDHNVPPLKGPQAAQGAPQAPGEEKAASRVPPAEPFVDRNGNGKYDPGYLERLKIWVDDWIIRWNERQKDHPERKINRSTLILRLKDVLHDNLRDVKGPVERIATLLRDNVYAAFGLLGFMVLVPIYTFFFLLEMHPMWRSTVKHMPAAVRDRAVKILEQVHQAISSFFRGRVLICMIDGVLTCIALYFCGVRFWLLLGLLTGAFGIVAIVGPVVAFIPTALFSLTDAGFMNFLVVTACFWGIQCADGFVLTPLILGAKVRLHPVTLLISLFVGGQLFGAFGVLAAVPVVCILKILGKEFVLPQIRALAEELRPAVATAEAQPGAAPQADGGKQKVEA